MSFWTKIGLADKNIIADLKDEIENIKKENVQVIEENRTLLEEILNLRSLECVKTVKDEIADLNLSLKAGFEDIKNVTENQTVTLKMSYEQVGDKVIGAEEALSDKIIKHSEIIKEIQSAEIQKVLHLMKVSQELNAESSKMLLAEIENMVGPLSTNLIKVNQQLNETEAEIVRTFDRVNELAVAININNKTATEMANVSDKILNEVSRLESIGTDVGLLNESLTNLWTIMKAIWVDSLINELEEYAEDYGKK